jgi:hypothetical protein
VLVEGPHRVAEGEDERFVRRCGHQLTAQVSR